MSEWILIKDRLPEDGLLVLVSFQGDDGWCIGLDYTNEELWGDWFNRAEHLNIAGGSCSEDAPYTHWMLMPEPPIGIGYE
jgi:hypothetical protein